MDYQNISVVAGVNPPGLESQWKERESLARLIEQRGFRVERTDVAWPRDHYVFHKDRYLTKREAGPCSEGGCFQFGQDFVVVSRELRRLSALDKEIVKEVNRYHPYKGVFVLPSGYFPEGVSRIRPKDHLSEHADLTCLSIRSRNLLIIDKTFYPGSYYNAMFRRLKIFADRYGVGLRYCPTDKQTSLKYFPLNCLVVPLPNGEEVVFVNKNAPALIKMLRTEFNLEVVEFDMKTTPEESEGSASCCTNIKHSQKHLDELLT